MTCNHSGDHIGCDCRDRPDLFGWRFGWLKGVDLAAPGGDERSRNRLTVIAIGTSLPRTRKHLWSPPIKAQVRALGNVLAPNIFNLLLIGRLTAIIAARTIPGEITNSDCPARIAAFGIAADICRQPGAR